MGVHLRPLMSKRPDDYIDSIRDKLIINDLPDDTEASQDRVKAHLYIELMGDIGLMPTCSCGHTTITAGIYGEAEACVLCDTVPKLTMDKSLESTLFLRAPPAVKTLILPSTISVLNEEFPFGNFKVIEYLMNRNYRVPKTTNANARKLMEKLKEAGIQRGYNFFVDNLDMIVDFLCDFKNLKDASIKEYLKLYKPVIFMQHLSFMSNLLFIMENSQGSTYYDGTFRKISDAVISMIGIDQKEPRRQEDLIGKCLTSVSTFYDEHFASMYNTRKGIFRQILYAGKGITAMRCVMTAVTDQCAYDSLQLPWCPTVQALGSHITSKLLKRGYDLNKSLGILQSASHTYNAEVDGILTELMAETGEPGFPLIIERFPILGAGSMMLMYGTVVKKDHRDKSVGFPAFSVRPSNLDFDGDECHLWFIDDKSTVALMKPLELHNVALDRLRADLISRNVEMTKPAITNVFRFLEIGDNLISDPEKDARMNSLFA